MQDKINNAFKNLFGGGSFGGFGGNTNTQTS